MLIEHNFGRKCKRCRKGVYDWFGVSSILNCTVCGDKISITKPDKPKIQLSAFPKFMFNHPDPIYRMCNRSQRNAIVSMTISGTLERYKYLVRPVYIKLFDKETIEY